MRRVHRGTPLEYEPNKLHQMRKWYVGPSHHCCTKQTNGHHPPFHSTPERVGISAKSVKTPSQAARRPDWGSQRHLTILRPLSLDGRSRNRSVWHNLAITAPHSDPTLFAIPRHPNTTTPAPRFSSVIWASVVQCV